MLSGLVVWLRSGFSTTYREALSEFPLFCLYEPGWTAHRQKLNLGHELIPVPTDKEPHGNR